MSLCNSFFFSCLELTKCMKKFPLDKIELLEKRHSKYWWTPEEEQLYKDATSDPFKNMVFTILSQNTSSKNTMRAYVSLAKKIDIKPESLAKLRPEEVAEAIRPGGLHKVKAQRLVNLGKVVMELWGRGHVVGLQSSKG